MGNFKTGDLAVHFYFPLLSIFLYITLKMGSLWGMTFPSVHLAAILVNGVETDTHVSIYYEAIPIIGWEKRKLLSCRFSLFSEIKCLNLV